MLFARLSRTSDSQIAWFILCCTCGWLDHVDRLIHFQLGWKPDLKRSGYDVRVMVVGWYLVGGVWVLGSGSLLPDFVLIRDGEESWDCAGSLFAL